MPENIQSQYDNTKMKMKELEEIYVNKVKELEILKQSVNNTMIIE